MLRAVALAFILVVTAPAAGAVEVCIAVGCAGDFEATYWSEAECSSPWGSCPYMAKCEGSGVGLWSGRVPQGNQYWSSGALIYLIEADCTRSTGTTNHTINAGSSGTVEIWWGSHSFRDYEGCTTGAEISDPVIRRQLAPVGDEPLMVQAACVVPTPELLP